MIEVYLVFSKCAMYFSVLLAVVAVFMYFRLNTSLRIFSVYLFMGGSIEYLATILAKNYGSNLILLHFYTILEFIILSLFFKSVFQQIGSRFPFVKLTVVVSSLCILNSVYLQPINEFNSYASTLVALFIIAYCIMTFYFLLNKGEKDHLSIKWLVAGLLVYQMTSFIVLASANLFIGIPGDVDVILWFTRSLIILLTKILFGIVLLRASFLSHKSLLYEQ